MKLLEGLICCIIPDVGPPVHTHALAMVLMLILLCGSTLPSHSCPQPCSCPRSAEIHCTFRHLASVPTHIPKTTQRINFGFNNIQTVGSQGFAGLERLELLMLHGNKIPSLSEGTFQQLRSLQVLKLSYNKLRVVSWNTFGGLSALHRLHLDHNQIELIYPGAFIGLTALRLLQLEGNRLHHLHPDTFVTFSFFKHFHISTIRHLYLSDNQLASLSPRLFLHMNSLETLHLHGNPWRCDCGLQWLVDWNSQTESIKCKKDPALEGGQLCPKCFSPRQFKGTEAFQIPAPRFSCTKPTILSPEKLENSSIWDESEPELSSVEDFQPPLGNLALNLTDNQHNMASLACVVKKPGTNTSINWERLSEQEMVINMTFSSYVECSIDKEALQRLWRMIAYYYETPAKLQRGTMVKGDPILSYEYRQVPDENAYYYTELTAKVAANPRWLMQPQLSFQLERRKTTTNKLVLIYRTELSQTFGNVERFEPMWVMIQEEAHLQTAVEGTDVQFDCKIIGSVSPVVKWIFPDLTQVEAPYMDNDHRVRILANGTLLIRAVDTTDSGIYQCVAKAEDDVDVMPYRLSVKEVLLSPEALNGREVSLFSGGVLNLSCLAVSVPNAQITWFLPNNTILHLSTHSERYIANDSTLIVREISAKDSGYYVCTAMNLYGVDILAHNVLIQDKFNSELSKPRKVIKLFSSMHFDTTDQRMEEEQEISGDGEPVTSTEQFRPSKKNLARKQPAFDSNTAEDQNLKEGSKHRMHLTDQSRSKMRVQSQGKHRTLEDKREWETQKRTNPSIKELDPQRWADILAQAHGKSITDTEKDMIHHTTLKSEDKVKTSIPGNRSEDSTTQGLSPEETGARRAKERQTLNHKTTYKVLHRPTYSTSHDSATLTSPSPPQSFTSEVSKYHNVFATRKQASKSVLVTTLPLNMKMTQRPLLQEQEKESPQTVRVDTLQSSTPGISSKLKNMQLDKLRNQTQLPSEKGHLGTSLLDNDNTSSFFKGHEHKGSEESLQVLETFTGLLQPKPTTISLITKYVADTTTNSKGILEPVSRNQDATAPHTSTTSPFGKWKHVKSTVRPTANKIKQTVSPTTHAFSRTTLFTTRVTRTTQSTVVKVPHTRFGKGRRRPRPKKPLFNERKNLVFSPGRTEEIKSIINNLQIKLSSDRKNFAVDEDPASKGQAHISNTENGRESGKDNHIRSFEYDVFQIQKPQPPIPVPTEYALSSSSTQRGESSFVQKAISKQAVTTTALTKLETSTLSPWAPEMLDKQHSHPLLVTAIQTVAGTTYRQARMPDVPSTETISLGKKNSMSRTATPTPSSAMKPFPTAKLINTFITMETSIKDHHIMDGSLSTSAINAQSQSPHFANETNSDKSKEAPELSKTQNQLGNPLLKSDGTLSFSAAATSVVLETSTKTATFRTTVNHVDGYKQVPILTSGKFRTAAGSPELRNGYSGPTPVPFSTRRAIMPCIVVSPVMPFSATLSSQKLQGATIPANSKHGQRFEVHQNGTFVIRNVRLQDRGQYLCMAQNPHGSDRRVVTLIVLSLPPKIQPPKFQHVTSYVGKLVLLPCSAEGRPLPQIAWLLPDKTFLRPVGLRDRRAVLLPNGTLKIPKATFLDNGNYKCIASNAAGADTTVVHLHVAALPPMIEEQKMETLVLSMGQSVYVHCTARGEPEPTLKWTLPNGTQIKASQFLNRKFFVYPNGTLLIRSGSLEDGGSYECSVTNLVGTSKRTVNIGVKKEPVGPDWSRRLPQGITVTYGATLYLHCDVAERLPGSTLWRLPSKKVVNSNYSPERYVSALSNGTLVVRSIADTDAGDYLCIARTDNGQDVKVFQVQVMMKPATIEHKEQTSHSVLQGGNIKVDCVASGFPNPEITWSLPDGRMVSNALQSDDQGGNRMRRYTIFGNGTLFLDQIGKMDEGDYTCYAENKVGKDQLKINVKVMSEPPQIFLKDDSLMQVRLGDPAILNCEAAGEPTPKITWLSPANKVITSFTEKYQVHSNGSLTFKSVAPSDSGMYTCVAHNGVGNDIKYIKLQLLAWGPQINGKGGSFAVRDSAVVYQKKLFDCKAGGFPAPRVTWVMPYGAIFPAPYVGSRIEVYKNGTLELRGLRQSDSGQLVCRAQNKVGESRMTVQLEVVSVPQKPSFDALQKESLILTSQTTMSFSCSASGTPPPDLTWILPNGTQLKPGTKLSRIYHAKNGTLLLFYSAAADAGTYRCIAKNVAGQAEKFILLENGRQPEFRNRSPGLERILHGETLRLHCIVDGLPQPHLTWILPNGFVLDRPQTNGRVSLLANGTLFIREVVTHDRGTYTCKAVNEMGSVELSFPVIVIVYPPHITSATPASVRISAGHAIYLKCQAIGIPKAEVFWDLPDNTRLLPSQRFHMSGGKHMTPEGTLVLQTPVPADSGVYKCNAKNVLGMDSKPTYLQVL
nr:PREDICTED: matrix-remodeling-associated protein 5 [Latimeria chalumnae]|eukprot:XP_014349675.1 PREDICTED: matrix-remodeling-associated protein 5 [Latimeria chalumnae]